MNKENNLTLKSKRHKASQISIQQIKVIKSLSEFGTSAYEISKRLGISYPTVRSYTDPKYREKLNKYSQKYHNNSNYICKKCGYSIDNTIMKYCPINSCLTPVEDK